MRDINNYRHPGNNQPLRVSPQGLIDVLPKECLQEFSKIYQQHTGILLTPPQLSKEAQDFLQLFHFLAVGGRNGH